MQCNCYNDYSRGMDVTRLSCHLSAVIIHTTVKSCISTSSKIIMRRDSQEFVTHGCTGKVLLSAKCCRCNATVRVCNITVW